MSKPVDTKNTEKTVKKAKKKKSSSDKRKIRNRMSNSKMRFGRDIQLDKFQTSDTIKIICMVIAIIIIPLELFVESYLTDVERPMIEGI